MKRVSIILNNGVVSPAKLMVNFSSFIQLSKGTKTLESNLHSSGLLLIILNYFDIEVVEGKEDIINYALLYKLKFNKESDALYLIKIKNCEYLIKVEQKNKNFY